MLEMTDEALKDFQEVRQEIMDLGLTEEQYNQMISAGISWIAEAYTILERYLKVSEAQHDIIKLAFGNTIDLMMKTLEYYYCLLRREYRSDQHDPENFKKDRKDLLEILKSDWFENPKPAMLNMRFM